MFKNKENVRVELKHAQNIFNIVARLDQAH